MNERSLFTKFWVKESTTTRTVLARIPEGSDYRPDPRSRTAHEIAWQIVCEEKMIIDALESGKAEWAPPPMPATMKEVLEAYDHYIAHGGAPSYRQCVLPASAARGASASLAGAAESSRAQNSRSGRTCPMPGR